MPHYFYLETKNAHESITGLYDFVWPTAAAMWNLRWQVNGYLHILPDATKDQLDARFTEGAHLHGVNIRRACVEHTWEDQTEAFARVVLINTFAIYEGWIEVLLNALGANTVANQKALQFPGANGAVPLIARLTSSESPALKACVYPCLCNGRYYAIDALEAMLKCYRFFKELRNSIMHGGGIADQKLMNSYAAFSPVATSHALGVREVPTHSAPSLGSRLTLPLRGAVGFSYIVFKIMATVDAELSCSLASEPSFVAKWKALYPNPEILTGEQRKRDHRINWMMHNAGFPRPQQHGVFATWLAAQGLAII